jgi:four helix bundle protein
MHTRPYERLIVWQEAHRLCLSIYALTNRLPSEEKFALKDQMHRAAYSIPMNIAEGNIKRSTKERRRFMEIAEGSLEELHYQCRLMLDLQYLDSSAFEKIDDHIQRVSFLLMKWRQCTY